MQDGSKMQPEMAIKILNDGKWWDRYIGEAPPDPITEELCDAIDLAVAALAVMQDQKK